MLKATQVLAELPPGAAVADRLTLPFERRQKSRFVATLDSGRAIALSLPRGHVLRHGALLELEGGGLIQVCAAPEELSVVTSGDATELARAAYHLGNRHVPIELQPDHLKIEPDHVLASMLRAMHLTVTEQNLPFEPEGGAYAGGAHGHGHGQGHNGHDHGTEHHHHDDQGHSH